MADLMQAWVAAMRTERFARAWALSLKVLRERDPATRDDPSVPYHLRWVWDGKPFDGMHVMVRCYHGLGDTIQFARYLPHLAKRAASVTVEAPPPLLTLLGLLPGIDRLVPFDRARPLPPSDCDVEIMELGFALRQRPAAAAPPYINVGISAAPAETRIGICHLAGRWDEERCLPGEYLQPICRAHPCISLVPQRCDLPVLNPQGCTSDVMATASLVASTSLVITVDTMIAHLAGAMARPVWLLLKAKPDWRWSTGRTSSWYPSMRLYRQPRAGDWTSVLTEVEGDLATLGAEPSRDQAFANQPCSLSDTRRTSSPWNSRVVSDAE